MLGIAVSGGFLADFSVGRSNNGLINVSHLLFANDTLLFCDVVFSFPWRYIWSGLGNFPSNYPMCIYAKLLAEGLSAPLGVVETLFWISGANKKNVYGEHLLIVHEGYISVFTNHHTPLVYSRFLNYFLNLGFTNYVYEMLSTFFLDTLSSLSSLHLVFYVMLFFLL